jgi:hypothetical protein
MRRKNAWMAGLPLALVCVAISTPAYAYIDPGAGSLIVQAALAGFAAAAAALATFRGKITNLFRRIGKRRKPE